MLSALLLQIAYHRSREGYKYLQKSARFSSAAILSAEFCIAFILSLYNVAWTFNMKCWEGNPQ